MRSHTNHLLVLLLVLVAQISFAQDSTTITGKVTDNQGLPLPGVNIVERGTNNGTQSDFDGNFTINASKGSVLTFSYLGFTKKLITVGNETAINVQMEEDAAILDEVVVTGVASGTSKRDIGVSVNSVKAEDLEALGAQSVDEALQGKIAGTIIQSTSGQPGQQQNIVLRAINSLNSSQPLILIDGVQVLASQNSIGGASNLSSRLADLDFSNVERVETISGAAAGTIYGAQGANGVINIISKKGKAGAPKVNIRTNVGFTNAITGKDQRRTRLHHYQTDAQGFLTRLDGTRVIDLNDESQYGAVVPNVVDVNGTQLGAQGINDTPFAEETFDATDLLFETAVSQSTGITVSGGSDTINYAVSGNRSEEESVLVPGKYTKYDARLNFGFDLSKKIRINTRFDVVNSSNTTGANTDNANANNAINNVFQNLPHVRFDILNSDGDLTVSPDETDPNSTNPFFFRDIQIRQDDITRYLANIDITYDPVDYLSFNLKYGYDTYTEVFTFFQENQDSHLQASTIGGNRTGLINQLTSQEYFQNLLLSANLNLDFEEDFSWSIPLKSTTTVNFDWRDRNLEQTSVSGADIPAGPFGSININQANVKTFNFFFGAPFRTYGVLVNQKFTYGRLFGFSGGFRTDYSNRFGSGKNFTFPRADAYINFDDLIKSDNINILKLRAAYGEAGIQPLFSANILTFNSQTVGSEAISSIPGTLSNEDLDVEISRELEVGADFGIRLSDNAWFSSLDGFVNFFDRKTEGAVFGAGVPTSSSSGNVQDNAYDITSDGIEASLNTSVYNSDKFSWNFGIRYTQSKAILDRIENGLPVVIADNFVLEEGQEIGSFSVFEVLTSLDQTDLEGNRIIAAADENDFTVASSGYVVNKNTGNVVLTPDKRTVGSSQPDFVMTFLNDFRFNNFVSLSVQLDWFQGLDVYNRARQWLYNNALHEDTAVPISIEDPTGAVQTGAFVSYYTSLYNTNVPTSEFVEDASFLRFRDITLRFDLNNLMKFNFLDKLSLSISGRNLITITDYKGLDPEAARSFGNTFQRGFDEFTHPNTKSYNFGLNITF
ncbi:SusC/RagA family TonB-linked outer membrane protein [Aquimarina litoralis]|uniref:SusC/RagA family TonB-linked outer membrane protein n=1 Tax=Aquimarina litoralis TaxID=584605 RepID=UPI001C55F864|nr:SusC/RagA family TonB-linked outer membrane protein [Aquimarina litoralis]MBW1296975.1 SusC/RagA family TonB-linked outer membrane protein [Aquimarina litoralis]